MTPISKPFYKKVNEINDIDELRDYVTYLQSEVFNLIDAYNELSSNHEDLQRKTNLMKVQIHKILDGE